jgi:hypothetical protein
VIDRQGRPADHASAPSDALTGDELTTGDAPSENLAPAQADRFERSAHSHDHEASLHDRLAAAASGWLYFGFLHAAEAHRTAARRDRALAAAERRRQPTG